MGLEVYISRCSLRLPFFVTSSRYHRTQINPVIYDHIYTVNDGLVPTHYVSISLCFPIPLPVPAGRCVLPTASSACVSSVCVSSHARPDLCSMAVRALTTASKGGRLHGSWSQHAVSSAAKSFGQDRSSIGRSCSLHTCHTQS